MEPAQAPSRLTRLRYNAQECREDEVPTDQLKAHEQGVVTWLDVEGLGDPQTLKALARTFRIHRLALEDVAYHQRPKVQTYDNHVVLVAQMVHEESWELEQVTFLLTSDGLVTFQEGLPGDSFEPVRRRLREDLGVIRERGPDYLLYALLDAMIDSYFPVMDALGDQLSELEEEVLSRPTDATLSSIRSLKRRIMTLRRALRPLQDTLGGLARFPTSFIEDRTRIYFHDCYDHTLQLLDALESHREHSTLLLDTYLSAMSNRLNEVMRSLTVVATIFMPLSFIAGLYGMNFNPERSPWNMPELNWWFGYPYVLSLMALVAVGMVSLARRKGWF